MAVEDQHVGHANAFPYRRQTISAAPGHTHGGADTGFSWTIGVYDFTFFAPWSQRRLGNGFPRGNDPPQSGASGRTGCQQHRGCQCRVGDLAQHQ